MDETPTNNQETSELPTETLTGPKKKKPLLKRLLLWAFAIFAMVLALVILCVAFFLGPIAKTVANKAGASILGVDNLSIENLELYPFVGYVRVENVLIGKPVSAETQFSHDLLTLEYFEFDFEVLTAFSQKKVINRIELKNLNLTYEKPATGKSNVEVLAARFEKPESEKSPKASDESAKKSDAESEPIYLAARYVDVQNIRVHAFFSGVPTPIPPVSFEFKDGIGLDENLTPVQFGLRFAGNFMSVFRMLNGTIIGDLTGATVGAVSDVAGFTAGLVSGAAEGTATAVTDVADATGAVLDGAVKILDVFSSEKKEDAENKK